uniref:Capsid protein n=1 Tax=Phoenicopteridae parvo-like hybrid virus TaxID=2794528 RepID=A0A8A4XDL0_9VIRU|nr:MAG: capsid protein [Phoenicopteridae parvo-like hybrid virus]
MKRKRGFGDFTAPGYNYLGPGNVVDDYPPVNKNDAIAREHDIEYGRLGKKAYIRYSKADEDALSQWTPDDFWSKSAIQIFNAKKELYKRNIIGGAGIGQHHEVLRGAHKDKHEEPTIQPINKEPTRRESFPNLRRIGDDSQSNEPSNSDQQAMSNNAGNAADGGGSGNEAGLKETPVDIPNGSWEVFRGPPTKTFASLPFGQMKKYFSAAIHTADFAYRMTSPFDPEVGGSNAFVAGGGSSAAVVPDSAEPDGGLDRRARWFGMYAGMYDYYHVLGCRWNVWIENLGSEPLYIHQMYYNDNLPPQIATNEDISFWPGVHTKVLEPHWKAIGATAIATSAETNTTTDQPNIQIDEGDAATSGISNYQAGNNIQNRIGRTSCGFSGSYRPGDFKREIIRDADVENWTATNANPILTERLLFRFKPENPGVTTGAARGDQVHFKFRIEIEYLVNFHQLKDGLRWPVQRQPITIQINSSGTSTQ